MFLLSPVSMTSHLVVTKTVGLQIYGLNEPFLEMERGAERKMV